MCPKEVGNKNSHGINNNCLVYTGNGNTQKHVCNKDNDSFFCSDIYAHVHMHAYHLFIPRVEIFTKEGRLQFKNVYHQFMQERTEQNEVQLQSQSTKESSTNTEEGSYTKSNLGTIQPI